MTADEDYQSWLSGVPDITFDYTDVPMQEATAQSSQQLLSSRSYCDVTLRCEGENIQCHRFVLSQFSSVFSRMFQSSFKEGNVANNTVEIQGINFELLEKTVQFLYGNPIEISAQELMTVLEFADMYDITLLHEICGKMLFENITPTVAMTLWKYIKQYNIPETEKECQDYCLENFSDGIKPQIAATSGFLESEPDLLIQLLSHYELKVPNENEVFLAILDWLMFDQTNRATHLKEVLESCIRIENMDIKLVSFKIDSHNNQALNEQAAGTMLQFMLAINGDKVIVSDLKPRECTSSRDSLTMHLHNSDSDKIAIVSCIWQSNDEDMHVLKVKKIPLSFSHIQKTYCFDCRTYAANRGERGGLHCRAPANYTEWREITGRVPYDYHLLRLGDGKILYITNEGGVTVTKLSDLDTWLADYKQLTEHLQISANDLQLTAVFANHLFMFVPEQNIIHVFETLHGHFVKSITATVFNNDSTCVCITSKKNIACLVGNEFIYIIHLDRLLHQTPAAGTDCEPPDAKRLKIDNQSATSMHWGAIKRVAVPETDDDGTNTAALIYGEKLYIAEKNSDKTDLITLHSTCLAELLELEDETTYWDEYAIPLSKAALKVASAGEYKLELFNSKHKNPFH